MANGNNPFAVNDGRSFLDMFQTGVLDPINSGLNSVGNFFDANIGRGADPASNFQFQPATQQIGNQSFPNAVANLSNNQVGNQQFPTTSFDTSNLFGGGQTNPATAVPVGTQAVAANATQTSVPQFQAANGSIGNQSFGNQPFLSFDTPDGSGAGIVPTVEDLAVTPPGGDGNWLTNKLGDLSGRDLFDIGQGIYGLSLARDQMSQAKKFQQGQLNIAQGNLDIARENQDARNARRNR